MKKLDGNLSVTLDFKMVNKKVVNDVFTMHQVKNQLEAMSRSSLISTLDLKKRYHQLKLAEGKRNIGFHYTQGVVLVVGFADEKKNSWSVFQRLMDAMLGELQPYCVVV